MHPAKLAASLLVLLALVVGATPARAETVNCTPITAVPFVILFEGVYCFIGPLDLVVAGPAIDIRTNNVILDLNGFKLGGLAAGPGTFEHGIFASNRKNITIKNGTVRGFLIGIALEGVSGSQGHIVEDIRADQNRLVGIHVAGSGNIVRNNQVVATGGTTTLGANASVAGIVVFGAGPRVLNNDVIDTVKVGTGTAFTASGILLQLVTGGLVVNNRITVADVGIDYATGGSTGKYRDNLTFDVPTATRFVGGTDAGNNN